jgi:hypothetical protein
MAKSIRVSDELYYLAAAQARLMHRSLAQQVEYWASLGQALEQRGSMEELQQASLANIHGADRDRVRRGRISPRRLHMIPAQIAREAVVVFPSIDAFASADENEDRKDRKRAKPRTKR